MAVSVLFNEPKLLKCQNRATTPVKQRGFSALQRAEIAEMDAFIPIFERIPCFSALQRAEIAEIPSVGTGVSIDVEFQCSSTSRNC